MVMNMYGNEEVGNIGSGKWKCVNCDREDMQETEMCECWDKPYEMECSVCGNVWDGYAQCTCLMMIESSDIESSDNDNSDVMEEKSSNDGDSMSMSSEASELYEDFEETGHIPMEVTRTELKQLLSIARSQMKNESLPEWLEESCDDVVAGNFTKDGFFVPNFSDEKKREIIQKYPMLTNAERVEFYEQMGKIPVEDIVDDINIKRMRSYEQARVYKLEWPVWVYGEQPTLEFVSIMC